MSKQEVHFDEWMLTRAMHTIMDEEVAELPSDVELADTIVVSDHFRARMDRLTKQSRRHQTFIRSMRALAAVFVAALLIFSAKQLMDAGFFSGNTDSDAGVNEATAPMMDNAEEADTCDEASPTGGAEQTKEMEEPGTEAGAGGAEQTEEEQPEVAPDSEETEDEGIDSGKVAPTQKQAPEEINRKVILAAIRESFAAIGRVFFPGVPTV